MARGCCIPGCQASASLLDSPQTASVFRTEARSLASLRRAVPAPEAAVGSLTAARPDWRPAPSPIPPPASWSRLATAAAPGRYLAEAGPRVAEAQLHGPHQ